jgi:hypothetical protein
VPSFLSPAWIAALSAALADVSLPASDAFTPFTLRQVVTGGPGGAELEYQVTLSARGIRVGPAPGGSDPPADLTFASDYDTAVALNRGDLSAQEALESGRLEVGGRLDRITGARKMLVTLADAARDLRAATIYDPVS